MRLKTCFSENTSNIGRLIIFTVISFLFVLPSSQVKAAESYQMIDKWPSLTGPWYFAGPQGITTDTAGNVYVTDTNHHLILKFDSNGSLITKWGSYGTGDGQFNSPRDLTVDSSGNTYVVDTNNQRIQKFDSSGAFITKWGSAGSGDGQFNSPQAVTADSSDNIYIADTSNHRIQKFDSSGNFISKFGSYGTTDGLFRNPRGVTVDAPGYIYVSDTSNNRVQKFDSTGTFVTKWGGGGSNDGMFNAPYKIAVSSSGYVYVAEVNNNRVQVFDTNGSFIEKWASHGSDNGMFYSPYKLTVDSDRYIYVVDTSNNRIQKLNSSGEFITKWGSYGMGNGQLYSPRGISLDSSDTVYVADTYNHRIQKFDSSGNYQLKFGTYGTGDGLFNYPYDVAVDSAGNIFVADTYNHRIQKFDRNGIFLTKWGGYGTGTGSFNYPRGIMIDYSDNIYVADTYNNRIQKFDNDGNYISYWGSYGTGTGQFYRPCDIAIDLSGNFYVVEMNNNRMQKFDSDTWCLAKWGTVGSDDGQFLSPQGVAVDQYGYVYVTDTSNHRIQKFSSKTTAPVTDIITNPDTPNGENGWFISQPTITLSANEPVTTYFHWDNDADSTYTASFIAPVGEHTLTYHSIDEIGNIEAEQTYDFNIDGTNPAVTGTSPVNGATEVTVSDTITVNYDETVTAGSSFNLISVVTLSGSPVNISKTLSGNQLLLNLLSVVGAGSTLVVTIPADAVTDRAGNPPSQGLSFSFTSNNSANTGGSGGGGGGGSGSSDNSSNDDEKAEEKLEKNIVRNGNTVAGIPNIVRITAPVDSLAGNIKSMILKSFEGSVLNINAPLKSKVTEVSLSNGTLSGPIAISLSFDKNEITDGYKPAIYFIENGTNSLQPIGGLVDENKCTVSAFVSKLGRFAIVDKADNSHDLKNTYKDMSSHWAEKTVAKLADIDILTGYANNRFKPDSFLTRAELAVIIARALDLDPDNKTSLAFEDNHTIPLWARNSIANLCENNIIMGVAHKDKPGRTFDPNRPVTRAEFAVIINRAIKLKSGFNAKIKTTDFKDDIKNPSWAKGAINTVSSLGVINGYPGNTFRAGNHTSRAEAAAMISRMLDLI